MYLVELMAYLVELKGIQSKLRPLGDRAVSGHRSAIGRRRQLWRAAALLVWARRVRLTRCRLARNPDTKGGRTHGHPAPCPILPLADLACGQVPDPER